MLDLTKLSRIPYYIYHTFYTCEKEGKVRNKRKGRRDKREGKEEEDTVEMGEDMY